MSDRPNIVYASGAAEFPRTPYTGSPVSEKTSTRQLVNRGNLPHHARTTLGSYARRATTLRAGAHHPPLLPYFPLRPSLLALQTLVSEKIILVSGLANRKEHYRLCSGTDKANKGRSAQ